LGPSKYSKPINLGHPINTENDENGFVVSTDGSDVYYSSNVENKKLRGYEVYKFDLYQEARPDEVLYVSGQVKDELGVAVTNALVEIKNPVTQEKAVFKASEYDGNYAAVIKVEKAEEVVLTVKAEDKIVESQLIKTKTAEGKPNTFAEKQVKIADVKIGVPYILKDINYGVNSAELTQSSLLVLNEFIEYLNDNPTFKIAIHGHTDNVGNPQQNLVLSTDRAFSVRAYLEEKGIESARLSHKGFGSNKPKMSNATEIGRATNRRTEFVILSK
jgi:outer membrane protein OmpA-like peptidoglycan-associated protein